MNQRVIFILILQMAEQEVRKYFYTKKFFHRILPYAGIEFERWKVIEGMHLTGYANMGVGGEGGRTPELKIHHDKWRIPACCKMEILADIAKDAIQNDIPFFRSRVHMDAPHFFIIKRKRSSLRFAVHFVNNMYYFIQVAHVVVVYLSGSRRFFLNRRN